MTKKRKAEMTVSIAGDTLNLREGETRTVRLPMTLRLIGGILYFTPPDITNYAHIPDQKELMGQFILLDKEVTVKAKL